MTRQCSSCGEGGLPERSAYCLGCGAPLASRQGAPGRPSSAYTPQHLGAVLVSRDAEDGERKEVTVLVADLAGSLAIADALDPEDTHALMNGFFALAAEAVHDEGGTLNQFRGDGFMALFGAPRARGDDAARALRAALRVRASTRAYAESVKARFNVPLDLRMGVNTGLVWVGAIGSDLRKDYTAEGPTVGIAARLESEASPGQILVGEETVRRCGGRFDLVSLGPRAVRGLSGPTSVFELVGEGAARTRLDVERLKGLTPFIARQQELGWLAAHARIRPGIHFVEVRGEPGIGKSRLLLEYAAGLPEPVARLTAHCREADSRRAYLPWLELLRSRRSAPDLRIERPDERSSSADVELAVRALLERAAEPGGVVVTLEDAQWLDPSSRRLLRALAVRPPAGEIVLLATLREGDHTDWGAPDSTERLRLGPLDGLDRRDLARAILGPSPNADALVELAALRGGGNPLFVEEVARSLRDGDDSLRHAAWLEISLREAPKQVPDSLRGVVAARVDGLPERTKRCVEAAAVIGRSFDAPLLKEVAHGGSGHARALAALCDAGLLRRTEAELYQFSHGIVREVAYEQLLRGRRAELHRLVAVALEERGLARTADGASRIGAHHDAAGDGGRAAPHLASAGRYYASIDAPAEASSHLRRALELLRAAPGRDLAEEASIALVLATCLNTLDHSSEAAAVLESIDESSSDEEDRIALATAAIQSGWVRFMHGNDVRGARRLIERGISMAEPLPDAHRTLTLGHAYLGRMLDLDGELDGAILHSKRVVDLAAGRSDTAGMLMAHYNLSLTLCDAGELARARASALEALELARVTENDLLKGMADVAMAKVLLFEGDSDAAAAGAARGIASAEIAQQRGLLHSAFTVRAYALALGGYPQRAHETFERLEEVDEGWPATLLHRSRGFFEIARYSEAANLAGSCIETNPPRMLRARALAVFGLALGLSGTGDHERAEAALLESISISDELNMRPYLAEAHRFLAELLAETGEAQRAAYFAERARIGFESCSMRAHAAEAGRMRSAPPATTSPS